MPVVFDEIVGTVEPPEGATQPSEHENAQTKPEGEPGGLVQQLRRIERRAERLRAD